MLVDRWRFVEYVHFQQCVIISFFQVARRYTCSSAPIATFLYSTCITFLTGVHHVTTNQRYQQSLITNTMSLKLKNTSISLLCRSLKKDIQPLNFFKVWTVQKDNRKHDKTLWLKLKNPNQHPSTEKQF